MYTKIMIFGLMVAVGAVGGVLHSPGISGEAAVPARFYESFIAKMIEDCESQAALLYTSSSSNLRNYGRVQAQIAQFLEADKEKLVNRMVQMQLEPKAYKIERFLDDQFYNSLAKKSPF